MALDSSAQASSSQGSTNGMKRSLGRVAFGTWPVLGMFWGGGLRGREFSCPAKNADMKDVKIFITGGAGYVGSRLAAHLLGPGHDVTVSMRSYTADKRSCRSLEPAFRFVKGDVRDGRALGDAMRGHDAVVHLAAIVGEAACSLDKRLTVAVNRDAATRRTRSRGAVTRNQTFILFSTCSNYGVSDPQSFAEKKRALNPLSLYASTKVEVEREALRRHGACATTVCASGRFAVYPARMRFDLLVSEMARSAALGLPIEVYKPEAWRPYLHIADAGRAVDSILRANSAAVARRVFNVVGDNYQKIGLVQLVRENFPKADMRVTDGQPDNRDYRVSAQRIERELNSSLGTP